MEKKLDGNYTRMLRAILNKSFRQHPTKQQLYCHLPPITKTIKIRRTRHTGHCWRSRDELISDVLQWTPSHGRAKAGRLARTYNSSVPIRDLTLKTCRKQWTIGRGGKRGSGISVLMVWHDDDDDDDDDDLSAIEPHPPLSTTFKIKSWVFVCHKNNLKNCVGKIIYLLRLDLTSRLIESGLFACPSRLVMVKMEETLHWNRKDRYRLTHKHLNRQIPMLNIWTLQLWLV